MKGPKYYRIIKLRKYYCCPSVPQYHRQNPSPTTVTTTTSSDPKRADVDASIWAEFDARVSECLRVTNLRAASIVDVDQYYQEPLLENKKNRVNGEKKKNCLSQTLQNDAKKTLHT